MDEQKMKQIITERCELIVHRERNLFYLTKRFQEQFTHDVDIFVSDENIGELLIKEKGEGNIRARHYSKKLMNELVEITEDKGRMRFVFFEDEERKVWRGILLPELRKSRLWKEIRNVVKRELETEDLLILYLLKKKYKYLVDAEFIQESVWLGHQITECAYPYMKKWKQECVLLCAWSLSAENAKIQRRCQRAEGWFSVDQPIGNEKNCTYKEMWGLEDIHFTNIEVEEFKGRLTYAEKYLLGYLEKLGEWKDKNVSDILLGTTLWQNIYGLQQKATEYYGREYVYSKLVMRN